MAKWPLQATTVLTPWEERLDRETAAKMNRETDDEDVKARVDTSLRQTGLVYCDQCGCWFQSSCLCDDFRRPEDL